MRVESHNQKFNNGCTKDSTKRVDVHIFYGFYTGTGSVQYGYLDIWIYTSTRVFVSEGCTCCAQKAGEKGETPAIEAAE